MSGGPSRGDNLQLQSDSGHRQRHDNTYHQHNSCRTSPKAHVRRETGTPTGTFNITVAASSGSLTHNTTFALVVQ